MGPSDRHDRLRRWQAASLLAAAPIASLSATDARRHRAAAGAAWPTAHRIGCPGRAVAPARAVRAKRHRHPGTLVRRTRPGRTGAGARCVCTARTNLPPPTCCRRWAQRHRHRPALPPRTAGLWQPRPLRGRQLVPAGPSQPGYEPGAGQHRRTLWPRGRPARLPAPDPGRPDVLATAWRRRRRCGPEVRALLRDRQQQPFSYVIESYLQQALP